MLKIVSEDYMEGDFEVSNLKDLPNVSESYSNIHLSCLSTGADI